MKNPTETTFLRRLAVSKLARLSLPIYAVTLTVLVALAALFGPFQESHELWTEVSLLEAKYRETERARLSAEAERTRLLSALKDLQVDWAESQETIRTLRELTKNPDMEQKLMEANRLTEKLRQERDLLIVKLSELREEIQARQNGKKTDEGQGTSVGEETKRPVNP